MLEPLTNDYFELVLNVAPGEPFHVSSEQKERKPQTEEQRQRLDENMRCFSCDSQTPLFFVSVEQ